MAANKMLAQIVLTMALVPLIRAEINFERQWSYPKNKANRFKAVPPRFHEDYDRIVFQEDNYPLDNKDVFKTSDNNKLTAFPSNFWGFDDPKEQDQINDVNSNNNYQENEKPTNNMCNFLTQTECVRRNGFIIPKEMLRYDLKQSDGVCCVAPQNLDG